MEIVTLSSAVATALIHALPHLTEAVGEGGAKAIGGKLGEQALELAKRLWQHIHPKIEASPAASEAVKDAASDPEDEDNLASLRKEIKKILTSDPALAEILHTLLENQAIDRGNQYSAQASYGGVAVGRDLHGGVTITNKI